MKPAIYIIECEANGHRYVGASTCPGDRRRNHFRDLRKGKGVNRLIQADFDKYGESAFRWYVAAQPVQDCRSTLRDLEEQVIASLDPEYNINRRPEPIRPSQFRKPRRPWRPAQPAITVEWKGEQVELYKLTQQYGADTRLARKRIKIGWTVEEALGLIPRQKPAKPELPELPKAKPTWLVTYDGVEMSRSAHFRRVGVSEKTAKRLRDKGYTWQETIEYGKQGKVAPQMKTEYYEYDGERKSLAQWAKVVGVSQRTLYQRIYNGWTIEQTLGKAPNPQQLRSAAAAARKSDKKPRGRPRKQ